jgi:hypothetical protein
MAPRLENRKKRRLRPTDLTVSVNGKPYRIININEHGVGFLVDSPEEIEINIEINPLTINGNKSVQIAGIPRHISQYQSPDKRLYFRSGWVCGAEFTTQHDLNGVKLLLEYLAENIKMAIDSAN